METYSALKIKQSLNWDDALVLKGFSYPWSVQPPPAMSFRALWDDTRFYFKFDVETSSMLTYIHENNKMEVVDSDRVEIFFRGDDRLDPYFCLEMDPLGRVLDYRASFYRKFEYEWQWPGNNQLQIKSNNTESGYIVEGSITMVSLKELNLLINNELQVGLFRGECLKVRDPQSSFAWISWVKPISARPDFHIPSAFGLIKLVTGDADTAASCLLPPASCLLPPASPSSPLRKPNISLKYFWKNDVTIVTFGGNHIRKHLIRQRG